MKYTLGYKYRIYPNKTQQNIINQTLGCARFVYNHFLAVRRDEWKANHKSVTYIQTSSMLTTLKGMMIIAGLKMLIHKHCNNHYVI